MKIDVGEYFVIVLVPEWAQVGDRMDLVEMKDESWECLPPVPGADGEEAVAELMLPRYDVRVPDGAKPGVTQLQVDLGIGQALVVTVPEQAQVGDRLSLAFDQVAGEWRMTIVRSIP